MVVPVASLDELPVIDISPLLYDDQQQHQQQRSDAKAQVAAAMRKACLGTGFFYITGQSISTQALFDAVKHLFDLPEADKARVDARLSPLHRGYTGPGGAHNCVPSESCVVGPDNKESFLLGAEGSHSPMHGPNAWPDIPGWQPQVQDFFGSLVQLSRVVARGLALSLGLPESFFDDKLQQPVAQLLLLRYPPPPAHHQHQQQQQAAGTAANGSNGNAAAGDSDGGGASKGGDQAQYVGCGAHTDCGFLTILAQDDVPGLQVKMPTGRWVVAPAIPGTFLVNLGDMIARWTSDLYKSTEHRVFNSTSRARHSAVFFCNADFDALVEPATLDVAVLAGAGAAAGAAGGAAGAAGGKYEPIKAGHYIMQKLGLMWDGDKAAL